MRQKGPHPSRNSLGGRRGEGEGEGQPRFASFQSADERSKIASELEMHGSRPPGGLHARLMRPSPIRAATSPDSKAGPAAKTGSRFKRAERRKRSRRPALFEARSAGAFAGRPRVASFASR